VTDSRLITTELIIRGAPVTESYARAIGADGFADNAAAAVDLARRLVGAAAASRQE